MLPTLFNSLLLVSLLAGNSAFCMDMPALTDGSKKLAIITDMEADDAMGLGLFAKHCKDHNIRPDRFIVGALLSNPYRKKALVQDLLRRFGYDAENVYAGTGGIKQPFEEEGREILSEEEQKRLQELDRQYSESSSPTEQQENEFCSHFETMLQNVEPNTIDVLLLTNPIDLVKTLVKNKDYIYKINAIYMMGGWVHDDGITAGKATFNWQLHIDSVKQLFELMAEVKGKPHSPQLILFSSHFFINIFNGYVNQAKFPEVIEALDRNKDSKSHPIAYFLHHMVKNWDDSMTAIKEGQNQKQKDFRIHMQERIGRENIGRQFAPADPTTTLGYLYPAQFILAKVPTKMISFTPSKDAKGRDCSIVAHEKDRDKKCNVFVVEDVDLDFMRDKLVELMNHQ